MTAFAITLPRTASERGLCSTCRKQGCDGSCAEVPAGVPDEAGRHCLLYAKDPAADVTSELARNAYPTAKA